MRPTVRRVAWFLLLATALLPAQQVPGTVAEKLNGGSSSVAGLVGRQPAVVLVAFSRKAAGPTDAWASRLATEHSLADHAVVRVLALEGVPGFVTGLIRGSYRRQLSDKEQANTLILRADTRLWQQVCGITDRPDLPCVLLVAADGQVRWHAVAAVDAGWESLRRATAQAHP